MPSPVVHITHREEFSAAHQLVSPELTEAENRALYGPCYTLHGHNYAFEVTMRGPVAARTGMVMDLNVLMRLMQDEIVAAVDHKHLNTDVPFLEGVIPTAENLAVAFWNQLESHLQEEAQCRLHKIRVCESRMNVVEYFGPGAT